MEPKQHHAPYSTSKSCSWTVQHCADSPDWLADNPAAYAEGDCDDKCYKDTDINGCSAILEGKGDAYDTWTGWLDIIAEHIRSYKHDNGTPIPIVFRFMHETSGRWFWWGAGSNSTGGRVCSDADYIAVWNQTHHYLHNYHDLHQMLWVYAPSDPKSKYESSFEQRYPGDGLVDIIGFDSYASTNWYNETILENCGVVANFSIAHGKVGVIAESGIEDGIQDSWDEDWFYRDFSKKLMTDKLCSKMAYALTWENAHPDDYWVPLPQDRTFPGFLEMYESDYAIFADDQTWWKYAQEYGYLDSP